jgi:hypothetical protein
MSASPRNAASHCRIGRFTICAGASRLNRMDLPCSRSTLPLHAGGKNPGSTSGRLVHEHVSRVHRPHGANA